MLEIAAPYSKLIKMNISKLMLMLILTITISTKCYLQNMDYGLLFETNLSSHTNINPTKPEDGQLQWNLLNTFGIGAYASKNFLNNINVTTALLFRQRGYNEEAQNGPITLPIISYPSLQNRFNYLSLDVKLKYLKNNRHKIAISPLIGISMNTLVSRNLESERIDEINDSYPVSEYQNNWKTLNLNYLIGFSVFQANRYSLDFSFARSITPLLSIETLVVKDWVWSMNLSISLQQLLKK